MKAAQPLTCPQTRRALALLAKPDAPQIDKAALIRALPDLRGMDWAAIIQIIIQVVLAMLENKETDDDEDDDTNPDAYARLRQIARQAAIDTVPTDQIADDLPHLIDAITATANAVPTGGFPNLRAAREAMRAATNATLRDHAEDWLVWNQAVATALDVLAEDGHLTNDGDYRHAWLQIASALKQLHRVART